MGEQQLNAGRLRSARSYAKLAASQAPQDWSKSAALAQLLFKLGETAEAHMWYSRASEHSALDYDVLLNWAAAAYRMGNPKQCHDLMAQAARTYPMGNAPSHPKASPVVVTLRSLSDSHFGIKTKSGKSYKIRAHKGGHFALTHLLDTSDFHSITANILADHIPKKSDFPRPDLLINTVACPDRQGRALEAMTDLEHCFAGTDFINKPSQVLRTTRLENAQRLPKIADLEMARTEKHRYGGDPATFADAVATSGFAYPFLIRRVGTQTGRSFEKIDNPEGLSAYLAAQSAGQDFYIQSYIDCQHADGLYTKARCFFIDGDFYPIARLTSDHWQIHSGDRYRVMDKSPGAQKAEQAYLADPEAFLGAAAFDALHAVRDAVSLDFFGIDFTTDIRGRLKLFEVNAAMRHNFDHAGHFPYTRPYLAAASAAFQAMVTKRLNSARNRPTGNRN